VTSRAARWLTFDRLVTAIVLISIFAMAVRVPVDSDTWWHLESGRWIVTYQEIPQVDPFSHTRLGAPWIDHSWLAQIVLFLVYDAAGYAGLGLLVAMLATVAFVFVRMQCRKGNRWLLAFTLITAAATSGVIWVARPQMFSFAYTAILCYLLHRFRQGDDRALGWIPPLMVLWVNTHGGFAVGFILLAVHLFGELGNQVLLTGTPRLSWCPAGRLALVAAISFLLVSLNPNGVQMWMYPFRTVGIGVLQDFIAEWRPPDFHQLHLQPFIWMVLAALTAFGLSGRPADWTDLTLVALFTYMSLMAGRNIALFALVTAPVIVRYGSTALEAWRVRRGGRLRSTAARPHRALTALNWAILLLVLVGTVAKSVPPLRLEANRRAQSGSMPVNAVEYLRREQPVGPMLNSYNWGGYLIWHLAEYPVFVDGRTDLYDNEFLREYLALVWCQPGWEQKLDDWGINLVLIEPESTLARLLQEHPDWQQTISDEIAVVFVRQ
jgi:hypothetical protein